MKTEIQRILEIIRDEESKTKINRLYPIEFEGKLWYEDDCDSVFNAYYWDRDCLNKDTAVYLSEDMWIKPNGKIIRY